MPDETTVTETVKTASASDGMVKITVEKYNEMVETIASQKGSITGLRDQLRTLRNEPPVINRTVVNKTPEMLAHEHLAWGTTFVGAGAALIIVGAIRIRLGYNAKS